MKSNPEIPRIPYRRKIYFGENGEVYLTVSGQTATSLARVHAPSVEEIRGMLLRIRRTQGWSQGTLASALGVPRDTLRRWEDASRRPCRSAQKLIWIVHALVFEPEELLKGLDQVVTWGKAGREEMLVLDEDGPASSVMPSVGG